MRNLPIAFGMLLVAIALVLTLVVAAVVLAVRYLEDL